MFVLTTYQSQQKLINDRIETYQEEIAKVSGEYEQYEGDPKPVIVQVKPPKMSEQFLVLRGGKK